MERRNKNYKFVLIMIIYLAGIFMGAIDTGIVTPARTVIQNNLLVDEKIGIWMITIYTLAYAASIPIMGKLADMFGRKYIYLASILLFGIGSLFCGLSQDFESFNILLIARVVQAIGGGGILPVATAEFGTTFPLEKRGMALGLVGSVYGIANIFGASAGSAILDLFGKDNWQYIFYVNIPITLFILIVGFICLPNTKNENVKKIDILGISILTVMVLSLLYGLRNIDFFDLNATFISTAVYPFLILFFLLLPLFIFAEKRAEDPVMNLSYFRNSRIIITLILSFVTGVVMMGMIFVPQFSENALKISSGSGGYFVVILGLFAGIGAPFSGKLIDKYGAKIILIFGFAVSILGSLFLVFVTANYPSMFTVTACLILMGLGMGFTMGPPLNYMMLENTKTEESNSALATLSLVRSIGTAIAPAIMIGFIAHAGAIMQNNLMDLFPKEVTMPQLPYSQELTEKINKLKTDPNMRENLKNIEMPDLTSLQKVEIKMGSNSDYLMPKDLLEFMQTADVTTITKDSKVLAADMFDEMTPKIISDIQKGIQSGIDAMNNSLNDMDAAIKKMDNTITDLESKAAMMASQISQGVDMPKGMSTGTSSGDAPSGGMPTGPMPSGVMPSGIATNGQQVQAGMKEALDSMEMVRNDLQAARNDLKDTINKMIVLYNAIPSSFETAKKSYLAEIDKRKGLIENEFQKTLNQGFKQVYLTVTVASLLGIIILVFYRKKKIT